MSASTHLPNLLVSSSAAARSVVPRALDFDEVYRTQFAFVWRSARRLGLTDAALDDAAQEVFVVVHRNLASFEGRSSLRTWLFGITLRVVRDARRAARRRDTGPPVDPDSLVAQDGGPAERVEKADAVRLLHRLLDALADDRREVFVMAELEQMPMPEISDALGINVNTAYARLRLARQDFEQALVRHHARDQWRLR